MQNPYEAPQADLATEANIKAAEIRKQHIAHEASIKFIGTLFFVFGILYIPVMSLIFLIVVALTIEGNPDTGLLITIFIGSIVSIVPLLFWVGYNLRRLKSGARVPAIFLAVLLLFGLPIGTLIGAYILYLLLCKKGRTVLSDEYVGIIEQTPHIKIKTPIIAWLLMALLIFAGIAVAFVSLFYL